jgi:hypothetical protein
MAKKLKLFFSNVKNHNKICYFILVADQKAVRIGSPQYAAMIY